MTDPTPTDSEKNSPPDLERGFPYRRLRRLDNKIAHRARRLAELEQLLSRSDLRAAQRNFYLKSKARLEREKTEFVAQAQDLVRRFEPIAPAPEI